MESQTQYKEPNTELKIYARVSGVAIWKVAAHPNYGISEQALRNRLHKSEFNHEQKNQFMRTVDDIRHYQQGSRSMPVSTQAIETH